MVKSPSFLFYFVFSVDSGASHLRAKLKTVCSRRKALKKWATALSTAALFLCINSLFSVNYHSHTKIFNSLVDFHFYTQIFCLLVDFHSCTQIFCLLVNFHSCTQIFCLLVNFHAVFFLRSGPRRVPAVHDFIQSVRAVKCCLKNLAVRIIIVVDPDL